MPRNGYGGDLKSMAVALRNMAQDAHEIVMGKGIDPKTVMPSLITNDRRFDYADPARLTQHVWDSDGLPEKMKLDDPYLKRGGERRPLDPNRRWD